MAREFGFTLWLDSAAESYIVIDEIKEAGVPVLIHPQMVRAWGDHEQVSYETAAKLKAAAFAEKSIRCSSSAAPKAA